MRVCPDDLKFKHKELLPVEKGGLIGNVVIMVEVTVKDKKRTITIDEQIRV
jgi:hypothetical protein